MSKVKIEGWNTYKPWLRELLGKMGMVVARMVDGGCGVE